MMRLFPSALLALVTFSAAAAQPSLTAREAEPIARAAAVGWGANPEALRLYDLRGGQCGLAICDGNLPLNPETGASPDWVVQYLTGSPPEPGGNAPTVFVRVRNGIAAVTGTAATNFAAGIGGGWIDSNVFVPATLSTPIPGRPEWTGQAFLDAYPDVRVEVYLRASQPDEARVTYDNLTAGCGVQLMYLFNLHTEAHTYSGAPAGAPGWCPPPVAGDEGPSDAALEFEPPRPNPASVRTDISFTIGSASDVHLEVVDVLGRTVATLAEGPTAAGHHTVPWALGDVPPGVYLLCLEASGTRRVALVSVAR